ncbi:MAG: twin-arginine translocase subunit TatC [Anaerolineae bacterium]|nr:twin-arginine translocase subunit TatC [Anaerolineae bacterium]
MDTKLITPPDVNEQPEEQEEGAVMGFFEHLEELRNRLFRAVLSILIGMGLSLVFTNPVLNLLKDTYGKPWQVLDPTDSVVIFFRVTLMLGAILASPMITYQILMFVLPGLTRKEKGMLIAALPGTTALFLVGVLFTWAFLVPAYVNFLQGFMSDVFRVDWTADAYIGFVTAVLFWHGAAFETPIVFFILGRMGFVTAASMLRLWRHAIVVAAIISAFITPTIDPFTMIIIMGILMGLYLLSVVLVGITTGFRRQPTRV